MTLKKKLITSLGVVAVMIMGLVVQSCQKDDDNIEADFVNPMNFIGEQHNEGLKTVLNSFTLEDNIKIGSKNSNFRSDEIRVRVEQVIKTSTNLNSTSSKRKGVSEFTLNFPKINSLNELNFGTWLNDIGISSELKDAVNETLVILESSQNLDEILSRIKLKEIEASKRFVGEELNTYYSHLAVAKYSATFWSPKSQGGEEGIKYLTTLNSKNKNAKTYAKSDRINWWKVFACDCVGGIVGNVAGYVGASAISAIMQY